MPLTYNIILEDPNIIIIVAGKKKILASWKKIKLQNSRTTR